jgi:hypothetical protein
MGMLWAGLFLDQVSFDQDQPMQARTPAGVLRQLQTIDACPGRCNLTNTETLQSETGSGTVTKESDNSKKSAHVQTR